MERAGRKSESGRNKRLLQPPTSPPSSSSPPNGRKVAVVYYLCRNRQLEHPHFIEVPLSSPDGLYLRDVINKLNLVRGKGMVVKYSWSCKRSYKNGFVWHDLSDDDLILPANGNEYVLKGSEIVEQYPSDVLQQSSGIVMFQNIKPSQQDTFAISRTRALPPSCYPASIDIKENKSSLSPPTPRKDEQTPFRERPRFSGNVAAEARSSRSSSWEANSYGSAEYRVYKPIGAANASTQTDDAGSRAASVARRTCTIGVSTDDGVLDIELDENPSCPTPHSNEEPEIIKDEISPKIASLSISSDGKSGTLESLIRADANKMKSFRILEEEEMVYHPGSRMRATNALMQLLSCGSVSVKDYNSLGLTSTYKPSFRNMKYPSPLYASSMMFGELDYLSDKQRIMGMRFEDKEYFSGSLIETKKRDDAVSEVMPTLKRSSSYNADRTFELLDRKKDKEETVDIQPAKCLPRIRKSTCNKPAKSETAKSPLSDGARSSSAELECIQVNNGGSKRITESSLRAESFRAENEKLVQIEERLSSGARVIIQSRPSCDDTEDASDS